MAEEFEEHPLRPYRRQPIVAIIAASGFLIGGIALALLLYMNFRNPPSAGSPKSSAVTGVQLQDFQAFQQQTNRSLQSAEQQFTVQQQELTRLFEQLNSLSGKVDLLQGPAASVDDPPLSPTTRAAPAPKKKTSSRQKPASQISVGGAPLPLR